MDGKPSQPNRHAAPGAGNAQTSAPSGEERDNGTFHETRTLEDEYQSTLRRLHDLEKSAAEREVELGRALDDAKRQTSSLQNALSDAERRLALATNDLANLRSLTATDVDTDALLNVFDDLNDAINETAFRFTNDLKLQDVSVRISQVQALQPLDPSLHQLLAPYLTNCAERRVPVEQAFVHVIQGIFFWHLFFSIFRPFSPRLERGLDNLLLNIQATVRDKESQDYSARWRSITYNSLLANDDAFIAELTKFIASTARNVTSVVKDIRYCDSAFAKLSQETRKVVTMALRWQDRARGTHLAYDYSVFAPGPNSAYNETDMRADDVPEAGNERSRIRVGLTIGAGLLASKAGETTAPRVLKKAQVIPIIYVLSNDDRMHD